MKKISISLTPMSYEEREELRNLRTNLLFCGDDKRVILMTSAISGEGKTEVSVHLAHALTELKKKVLVIDTDLRKSVMVSRLQVPAIDGGLSHFLSGQMELSNVVYATNIPGMHIIFAGPSVPNPTELLSGKRFGKLIASMKSMYDYVIIDAAPIGLVVDAAVIAKECDGSVLLLESGAIKRNFALDVKHKMENTGCPILGVVLNKVDRKKNVGYYNKYYGKYGKRYAKYYESNSENEEQ